MTAPSGDARWSIVVVLHNSRAALRECVLSVPTAAELVVVDNDSSDGGGDLVRELRPDARVVRQPNLGFGAGCNTGARHATGELLLFLNPDAALGDDHIFVSPPVNGWTFVVGLALPHPIGRSFADRCTPLLARLGHRFVEVQYFFAYPPIDLFAWARLLEGRVVRAFAITDSGVVWNRGRATREERALGLKLFDFRGVRGRKGDAGGAMILYPTEEHVLRLAGRWSLDPTRLDTADMPAGGLGYIALAPAAWRPTRLCKTG